MRKKNYVGLAIVAGLVAVVVYAAPPIWNTGTLEEQVARLNDIQPGLGTVMIEYGNRMGNMFAAAKGGNWDLAAYQLKEAIEIQEVGETTRPARAAGLKDFEATYLTAIDTAISNKDLKAFMTAFDNAVLGCNNCHVGEGFPFIQYVPPNKPLAPLNFKAPQ